MSDSVNFITDNHCSNIKKLVDICGFNLEDGYSAFHALLMKRHKYYISLWPIDGIAMVETGEPNLIPARTFNELLDLLLKIKAITPKQNIKCRKEKKQ